jgi:hypothetical protein
MEFQFQFGVVGVGYGGGKAHFVIAKAGDVVYRWGHEVREYFDAYVNCGSQKWSNYGKSPISGFAPVGEIIVAQGEVPSSAAEEDEKYQNRQAYWDAQKKAERAGFKVAFEAAVEKYGDNFCAKCKKQGDDRIAWSEKQKVEGE